MILVNYLCAIFLSYLLLEALKVLSNISLSSKKSFCFLLLSMFLTGTATNLDILFGGKYSNLKSLLVLIICYSVILVISKYRFIKSFIIFGIFFVIISIGDMICNFILTNLLNFNLTQIKTSPALWLFSNIIVFLINYLLIKSIKFIKNKNFELQIYDDKQKNLLAIVYIIITIILILISLIIDQYYLKSVHKAFLLFNTFIIVIYFIIGLYAIHTGNKLSITNLENLNLKSYILTIDTLSSRLKRFKHNYLNILYGFLGYIENDDMRGLKNYYTNLVKESETLKQNNVFDFTNITPLNLKGLIAIKVNKAESNNIETFLNTSKNINHQILNTFEFCEILGILLDNAIEECKNISDPTKKRKLNILLGEIDDFIVISIENTYNTKPNINKIFEKGYSTKGTDRGIGLYSVKNILEKFPNILLNTYLENNLFIQELQIKK